MNKAKCGKMWNNSMNGFNLQSQLSLIAGTVISSNKQEIICTFVQHTIDCYDCFNLTFELLFCASSQNWTCSKVISVGGWFIRSSYFVESMLRYSRRLSCSMMFHVTSVCVCFRCYMWQDALELPNPCSFEVSWDISTCSSAASACGASMNAHPNNVRKLLGVVNSMALKLPKLQKNGQNKLAQISDLCRP